MKQSRENERRANPPADSQHTTTPREHAVTVSAARRVIALYDAWSKPQQAAGWRAKLPGDNGVLARDPPPKPRAN